MFLFIITSQFLFRLWLRVPLVHSISADMAIQYEFSRIVMWFVLEKNHDTISACRIPMILYVVVITNLDNSVFNI
jgi:hypothetical protein